MLLNVLLMLLPLVIGYLVPLSSARLIKLVNQSLGKMVYFILFLMGLGWPMWRTWAATWQ
jgi:uncharacterized membrane protein YbjE (DUF340 family)